MTLLDLISQDVLTMIIEALHESYSPFELDQSVYSLALTCRHFYQICEPLLYSRYSNKDQHIGRISKFIRMLILRPDRWRDFKFVSIVWDYRSFGVSLTRDQHIEMLADVPFLKTKIDQLPAELYRLQNRTDGKIREEETREPHTPYVTDLAEAFRRLLDVGDVQNYAKLLVYMFNILSLYIQKLQIKINSSEDINSSRLWRSKIFTEASPLKFDSLEELHYVAVTSWESMPREVIGTTRLRPNELDICMKIPTLKRLKVDGFAFESEWLSIWVTEPRSCAVESLDLMYNFNVKFVQWEIFFSVFKKLKHFSYDGNSRDLTRKRRRIDALVTRQFLGNLMEGIFVHRNSLESLSLTGIRRSVYDHTHLKISTTPGFTQFFCLKHMKMQLDLLVGVEGESVGSRLHELLPESLETLELWSQTSIECMTLTENLFGLMIHKTKFPGFALREVKFGYAIEKFQVEDTWKNDLIKDLGENGIHLVFVGLSGEDVWWVHKSEN